MDRLTARHDRDKGDRGDGQAGAAVAHFACQVMELRILYPMDFIRKAKPKAVAVVVVFVVVAHRRCRIRMGCVVSCAGRGMQLLVAHLKHLQSVCCLPPAAWNILYIYSFFLNLSSSNICWRE